MNIRRILRLFKKELIQTRRDRRMLALLFIAPIFQLFIFGYAVSTDVNSISLGVYDEDRTAESRAFVQRFTTSGYFLYDAVLTSPREVNRALDAAQVQVVLHLPRGFAKDLARKRTAQVQTLLDGTDSRTARVIDGYIGAVLTQYAAENVMARLKLVRATAPRIPELSPQVRVWYNPELKSVKFMVPGVICLILLILTTILTAIGVVKEKELGTLEQLVVTPISAMELMLGKTLPFLLIGMVDVGLALLAALLIFHVSVSGSVLLLFALSALFLLTTLGSGLFISTISSTQHEATLSAFLILFPSVLLSGFIFPVENMPVAIQWITCLIPLRYFLEIIRGIFLRGVGLEVLWPQMLILLAFGVGILTLAAARFRKRLG